MTDQDLTIVVVPDGALGDEALAVAKAWAAAGLLRRSVWLSPSCVQEMPGEPPRVRASLISGSTVDQTDLFTLVGRRRLSWVRLIVVHLGTTQSEDDADLSAVALRLSDLLKSALPLGTSDEAPGTQLHRVKLVVPANGVTGLPLSILQPDWEVNAVASPEDRPDVDRSSIFVREESNFVGHAMNAICAAGGLWDGMPAGALDGVTTDSTTSEGWLHVFRPTVRAILADNRTESLFSRVTRDLREAQVVDFVDWGRRADAPEVVAARAATALLSSAHWVTPPPVYPARRVRARRSARDVAGAALRYNVRLFGAGWRWMVRSGQDRLDHALTGQLVGHDSDITVVTRPYPPATLAALSQARRRSEARTVGDLLSSEAPPVEVPSAAVWRDLRRVSFALVDGDPLPEGIRTGGASSLVEVIPKESVIPKPEDLLELGSQPIGVLDVLSFRNRLDEVERESEQEFAAAEPSGTPSPAEKATEGPTSEGPATPSSPEESSADLADTATPREGPIAASVAEQARQMRAWEARRKGSFLWLIAEDLSDRLMVSRARRDKLESMPEVTTEQAAERLTKAYGRLINTWRASVLVVFAALGLLTWAWLDEDSGLTEPWWVAVLILVAGVMVVAFANHRYFKADLRFRKESADAIQMRRELAEEVVTLRRDIVWLDARYRGLMMWAPLLAELVHRPWGEIRSSAPSIAMEDIERMPAAVAVAVRAENEAETFSSRAVTDAVNVLCPPGFLSRRWDEVLTGYLHESGRAVDAGSEVLDSDQLETRASPRRELLARLVDGLARTEGTSRMVKDLDEAIATNQVRLPARRVTRLGEYSDGEVVTDEDFYRASLRSATPFTLDLWTPEGQQQAKHLLQRSLVWSPLPGGEQASAGVDLRQAFGAAAVRVDLSGRCYAEHVTIFGRPEVNDAGPTWTTADIDDFN